MGSSMKSWFDNFVILMVCLLSSDLQALMIQTDCKHHAIGERVLALADAAGEEYVSIRICESRYFTRGFVSTEPKVADGLCYFSELEVALGKAGHVGQLIHEEPAYFVYDISGGGICAYDYESSVFVTNLTENQVLLILPGLLKNFESVNNARSFLGCGFWSRLFRRGLCEFIAGDDLSIKILSLSRVVDGGSYIDVEVSLPTGFWIIRLVEVEGGYYFDGVTERN